MKIKQNHKTNNLEILDPVCGKQTYEKTKFQTEYKEKRFFFCSLACMSVFKRNPEKYFGNHCIFEMKLKK